MKQSTSALVNREVLDDMQNQLAEALYHLQSSDPKLRGRGRLQLERIRSAMQSIASGYHCASHYNCKEVALYYTYRNPTMDRREVGYGAVYCLHHAEELCN